MNICEDCIKQDVCKFRQEVEEFEKKQKAKYPEPLSDGLSCKYKRTESSYGWSYTVPCTTGGTEYNLKRNIT